MERDVVQVLTQDHAVLKWLGERLQTVSSAAPRSLMFNELARALGAHETVIEETILPAMKSFGWRGLTSDVLTGHAALKRHLAEMLTMDRRSAAFDPAVTQLVEQLKVQCDLEDRKLLPLVQGSLDDTQRTMLAFEAELLLTRMLGEGRSMREVDLAQSVSELLDEAHLVLGSLPAGSVATPITP
jgi:hypothetical protein